MFGEVLRALRKDAGLTRRNLQDMTGISMERIYTYETKRSLPRTTSPILCLSDALGVDRQILLSAVCVDDDVRGRLIWQ